ncbi:alpha/beta hydrolase [Actinophytocola sp.]|uniref:alpha/beta hydrolase n=1 Tax=Actinophytocola sp. TaxID=1872138 RepID=UPI002ED63F28
MKPTRVVAIALIAILVGGLVFLRFGSGPDEVAVPDGARAGDLTLEPCEYTTENGDHAADCGTLVVPENRNDPGSRLIALPVVKIRAETDEPAEPIFHLEGGPGLSNLDFPTANRFLDGHDVVLVGYRGVDGSTVLDCPEVTAALRHSTDFLGEESFRAYTDAFRDCAKRLTAEGVDLDGYSLTQRVDDLEAARVALGYDRIDLLAESTGTRTAQIYSWRRPDSIHRSVMIGVNPPGHFLWDPATTDDLIRRYARLCAEDTDCRKRTDELAASMDRTAEHVPDSWGVLNIKPGNVRLAAFFGLVDSTSAAAMPAPATLDSWLSAAEGDPSGLWFASLAADLIFPRSFVWGEYAAIGTADAWALPDVRQDSILDDPGTAFVWAGGQFADAWPTSPDDAEYRTVRTSDVETLLIGGTLDFSAPARNATNELLPFLPNGHQVILAELGHTTDFWATQPEAGDRLISTFLGSGQVDHSLYRTAKVDFTPSVTHPALAKIILGTMTGLALVMVLSLLLMARRVRKKGGFGPKASAVLRSVFPLVLGLGGWFLAALVILTLLPSVPLDDELASALSVGMPVGLGIHLAWRRRDQARNVRTIGLVAAVAGALVGAWLGFHAMDGLLALLTTIAGATAAANLVLLALDIAWERPSAVVGTSRPLLGSAASR